MTGVVCLASRFRIALRNPSIPFFRERSPLPPLRSFHRRRQSSFGFSVNSTPGGLDDSRSPEFWADEDEEVFVDLAEEVEIDSDDLYHINRLKKDGALLPIGGPYQNSIRQRELDENPPDTLGGVPLLEQLFYENCKNPDADNSALIPILAHDTVLHRGFIEKCNSIRRMTRFRDPTVKEISRVDRKWLAKVGNDIKSGCFEFVPEQEVEFELPSGRIRMVAIPSQKDQIVLESMKLVLEAIYEPSFLVYSHGFRPGKGRQTALRDVKRYFRGMDYFLVCEYGKAVQEQKGHEMVKEACRRIGDANFEKLLYQALEIGYVNLCGLDSSQLVSTPKVMGISPILLNIYLHHLDEEIERLKGHFSNVKTPLSFPSVEIETRPLNRRLRFVRYADSVFVGVRGKWGEAEGIKNMIQSFMVNDLGVGEGGTETVFVAKEQELEVRMACFLGYSIGVEIFKSYGVPAHLKASLKSQARPRTLIPKKRLLNMFRDIGYIRKRNSATGMGQMTNWPVEEIVRYFDKSVGVLLEYYAMADNYRDIQFYVHLLKKSCALTLARKLKLRSVRKVMTRYGKDLVIKHGDRVLASMPDRSLAVRPLIKEFHPFLTAHPKRRKLLPTDRARDGIRERRPLEK
ncbi:hypothetical protein BSKO_00754 [Bryopsis sp. KO-2023]|nr:hypothetical protein BSKO_00754 [Bryopsis sp. KO-2023]